MNPLNSHIKKETQGEFLHPVLMFPPIASSQIKDLVARQSLAQLRPVLWTGPPRLRDLKVPATRKPSV
ncbi:hypothetical protein ASJ83_07965 [Methanocorpusculum parvum]|uniref:Uncharacterized protein n=1 Tax=Methanocorpusculum parvum TaxID=2193 RepID=A0AAX0Q8W1_9EURY|nr:hypothetical protein ASJ83_07965 [Methanocorpusculum parvum]